MVRLTAAITSLLLAVVMMGTGSVNADIVTPYDPTEWGFTEMALSVLKGASEVYGLRFMFNMDDLNEKYQCEVNFQYHSLNIEGFCSEDAGSSLKFTVDKPLPTVRRTWFGKSAEIEGSLLMNFEHTLEGSSEVYRFNVIMPVKQLEKDETDEKFTFSSTGRLTAANGSTPANGFTLML